MRTRHHYYDKMIQSLADNLGLSKLPAHYHYLLGTAVACQLLATAVTRELFPIISRLLPLQTRQRPSIDIQFGVQVVSMLHAIFASLAATYIYNDPRLTSDRLFGYSIEAGNLLAVSCGYFLWDIVMSIRYRHLYGMGFVWHAIFCFLVFIHGFGPFALWYGGVFLMFEWSTPFVYINWFLDKFGLSGSIYQLVNGALLIVVFTAVRICFGLLMSWQFFSDILLSPINAHRISAWHKLLYAVANIVLMSLNLVWIGRMLRAFTRRLLSSRAVGHKKVRSSSAQ